MTRVTLRLRNTLTRTVEPVEPADGRAPPDVRLRADGLSLRPRRQPPDVPPRRSDPAGRRCTTACRCSHVQNITDVGHLRDERFDRGEDRMLVAAGLEHKTTAEIADAYEAAFHADAALLNLLPAHVFPRATEHVPEMIDLAERLVDAGHAYASSDGNVYYSVASFPDYGALSGNTLDALRAGHRGDIEPDKRDSADFALWKAAGEGRMLKWPTPRWGEGFPGLAPRVLGDGPPPPGRAVRRPHRRDRQRLPASRGRDRPVRADRGRAAGAGLGPRRVPPGRRQEDGEVGRQHRADRRCRGARHRSRSPSATSA